MNIKEKLHSGKLYLPDNVVAVGNPCRVLREVNEHDYEYYFKDRKIEL